MIFNRPSEMTFKMSDFEGLPYIKSMITDSGMYSKIKYDDKNKFTVLNAKDMMDKSNKYSSYDLKTISSYFKNGENDVENVFKSLEGNKMHSKEIHSKVYAAINEDSLINKSKRGIATGMISGKYLNIAVKLLILLLNKNSFDGILLI